MRALLIVAALLLIMILLGWLSFRSGSDQTTITIDQQKIEQDARQAIDKGKAAVEEAKENLRDEEPSPSTY